MLTILLGLLIVVLLLLALPLDVSFRLNKEGVPGLRVGIAWGFGLIRRDFTQAASRHAAKSAVTAPRPKKPRHRGAKPKRKRTESAMIFVRNPGMPARLLRFAKDMLRQIRVREMMLNLDLGLDDPADTGRLYGALSPVLMLAQQVPRLDLRVRPDFTQEVMQASGRGEVRVVPLAVLGVMLGFLLSPTCWRAFYATIKGAGS